MHHIERMAQIAGSDDSDARDFVQVVRFRVAEGNQSQLIQVISDVVERWVRGCPGFLSCQMHASHDGNYVLNYARWQTETAFRAFTGHPEFAALNAAIRDICITSGAEPATWRLVRCFLPEPSESQAQPSVTLVNRDVKPSQRTEIPLTS